MHLEARGLTRDPLGVPGAARRAAIERDGGLERHQGASAMRNTCEVHHEVSRCFVLEPDINFDPSGPQDIDATRGAVNLRIRAANHDASNASSEDRIRTGRRATVMTAGLKRAVERRASRELTRGLERANLGV